jgi:thioredoxin-like negative regulator of GroEL
VKRVEERELATLLSASKVPVAAAFTRTGFAPSDELVTSLSAIEAKIGARMQVVQLDLDACKRIVEEQRIHRVPELLVWAAGGAKLLARTEGAMRDDEVLGLLEHALTRGA